jgi:hypothetical protein
MNIKVNAFRITVRPMSSAGVTSFLLYLELAWLELAWILSHYHVI